MFWIAGITIVLIGFAIFYFLYFGDSSGTYKKALEQAERGNYADARSIIRPLLDREPNNARAHFHMAQVYAIQGDLNNELVHLLDVKRVHEYTGEIRENMILNRLGEIYYQQEKFAESFDHYQRALRITPQNEEALAHLAFMSIGQASFERAEEFFAPLVQLVFNKSDYHIARGVCLAMVQNEAALTELEKGLELNPDNQTAKFLTALQAFRQNNSSRSRELIESLLPSINDPSVSHIVNRLAVAVHYREKNYKKALSLAERCLAMALAEEWSQEEYDARITVAAMSMLTNDLEKAGENLLELEIQNPQDNLVLQMSDYRMDLEEGITTIQEGGTEDFNFRTHLENWAHTRFPSSAIYALSGLGMRQRFQLPGELSDVSGAPGKTSEASGIIQRFNTLQIDDFKIVCEKLIESQGYKVEKEAPYQLTDGVDYIAQNATNSRALFRIRRWSDQNISDIFLTNTQNDMDDFEVPKSFVVVGAGLTPGARATLKKIPQIRILNEGTLERVLQKIM